MKVKFSLSWQEVQDIVSKHLAEHKMLPANCGEEPDRVTFTPPVSPNGLQHNDIVLALEYEVYE